MGWTFTDELILLFVSGLYTIGSLFSRRDPREGGPALDIERGMSSSPTKKIGLLIPSRPARYCYSDEQARESCVTIYEEEREAIGSSI